MKFAFVFFMLISIVSCNASSTKNASVEDAKVVASKIEDKKEEDCDDKAKKPIEIKEETISLSGNTGCSLDEVKP
jgi:hypothetical protein